jgi:hypothetical protein
MNARRFGTLSAALFFVLGACHPSSAQNAQVALLEGTLVAYSIATGTVTLSLDHPKHSVQLKCDAAICGAALRNTRADDVLTVDVDQTNAPTMVTKVESVARPVCAWSRLLAFGGSVILLLIVTAFAVCWKPWKFLIGADNRYSNSQCQMVLWFGAVASMYLGTLALRVGLLGWGYLGGIGITANVAAVTGLSALSFGGAKAITMSKIEGAAQAGLPPAKVPAARPRLRTDLFLNDNGRADFGDFQMILITVAAVAIFVGQAFHAAGVLAVNHAITLPDVDSSLLAGFGIGQGAYLVKKAALRAGDG